jgi:hypothetical protein
MGSYTIIWDFRGDDSDIEDFWKTLKASSLQKFPSANLRKSLRNLFKPKYATE